MNLWGIIKGLLIQEETDRTKQLSVEVNSSATTGTRTTVQSSQTADRTLNLPDADDTLVGRNTTDTLTNKTIDGDDNTLQDIDLPSLKVQAPDAGKFLLRDGLGNVVSGNTVPNGTVVGDTDTQTLENKTIDGTAATGNNTITADMSNMTYDNSTSGLTATDGQAAVDEVEGRVDTVEANKIDGPGTHADNLLLKTDGVDSNTMQTTGISIDDLNNVTGVNDLTVNGNLQVDGTTTSVNSATLEVTDSNITVNNNGNDATAEGAGLTVERTGTDGSIVYEDALTSKFKIGALGSEVEVMDVSSLQTVTNKDMSDPTNNVDTASADSLTRLTGNQQVVTIPDTATPDNLVLEDFQQVLTNKDIDGQTASDTSRITLPKNTTAGLDALTDKEGTVAYDTDLDTVVYNDGTGWNRLSGGQGGINYISNPDAENGNTDGWNIYDDGAGAVPIDGTGGSPGSSTFQVINASDLRGNNYFRMVKNAGPNPQGEGVSADFTIDTADTESTLQVSFDYKIIGDYTSGFVKAYIYDIDNATLLGPVVNDDDGDILNHTDPSRGFVGQFYTTDSLNYRLILHYTSTDTSGYFVEFDTVRVGPIDQQLVVNVTDWQQYTPILGGSPSLSDNEVFYRRVGDSVEIQGQFIFTGPGAASTMSVSLPPGLSIDGDKYTGNIFNTNNGGFWFDTGNTGVGLSPAFGNTAEELIFYQQNASGGGLIANQVANGDRISFTAVFPIVGWSASNAISNNQLNIQTACTSANIKQPTGTLTASFNTTVFPSVDIDTHNSYNTSTGVWTAPRSGKIKVAANIELSYSSQSGITNGLEVINLTTGQKVRGRQHHVGAFTAGEVTCDGIIEVSRGDEVSVQAFTGATGASYGFSFEGSSFSISYILDFSTYGVLNPNSEYKEISLSSNFIISSDGVETDVTGLELELSPGTWELGYVCSSRVQKLTNAGQAYGRTVLTDSTNTLVPNSQSLIGNSNLAASESLYQVLSNKVEVNITNTTTYKLRGETTDNASAGSVEMTFISTGFSFFTGDDASCKIWARRIK